jgi:hypothetical protein
VPARSSEAVSEHAVALMLSLDRNIHRAYARVRRGNFALDGLLGFNLHGRTVGGVGTNRIGSGVAGIMRGFVCKVVACDIAEDPGCPEGGVTYVSTDRLREASDIITLHCPLTPKTRHLIDKAAVAKMKHGVMLINKSRSAIVDTAALIDEAKSGAIAPSGAARLRAGDQALLRRPVERRHHRRHLRALVDLPRRPRDRAPGLLHRRGLDRDRRDEGRQHRHVREDGESLEPADLTGTEL